MNIVDRLTHWYAASNFGSSRLKPNFYSCRRPIYDALSPANQLTWRMFRAKEQVRVILILLGLLPAGVLGLTDVLFDGDQVNNGTIGALAAAGYAFIFLLTAGQWLDTRTFRRQFAEQLATIPPESIPEGHWYVRLFWWLALSGLFDVWVWPTKTQRESGASYAVAYERSEQVRRDLLANCIRWQLGIFTTMMLSAVPMALLMDYVPYRVGLFLPLLAFCVVMAIGITSWEVWKRRVWAPRILAEST